MDPVIYPKTDGVVLNQDAFRTLQLIRLPTELNGDIDDVSSFKLDSVVCLDLWCLRYFLRVLLKEDLSGIVCGMGTCPCHGSTYDVVYFDMSHNCSCVRVPATHSVQWAYGSSGRPNRMSCIGYETDTNDNLWIFPPTGIPERRK